jgi:EF hand
MHLIAAVARLNAALFRFRAGRLGLGAIAAFTLAWPVAAQQPEAVNPPEPRTARPDLPPEPSREAARKIEFSAANIALAFSFLDRDKDGRISREEAAGIRGVERNFDRADVNHDNSLSREEFEQAMKQSKPR